MLKKYLLVAKAVKKQIKKFLKNLTWTFRFFFRSPCFELYVSKQDRENIRYFERVKNDLASHSDSHIKPHYHREIPRKIWIYWEQGEHKAPFVVKECIKSWRVNNPNWEVTVLDEQSVSNFVEIPTLSENFPVRYKANLLRLVLLRDYGGIWADATTFAHRPLDEWLPLLSNNGLFMFSNPAADRDIENWFIASEKNHTLINEWEKQLRKYYLKHHYAHPAYFLAFYIYQWTVMRNKNLKAIERNNSSLNAGQCFLMKSVLNGLINSNFLIQRVNAGLPMSKLDWRLNVSEGEFILLVESLNKIKK